MISYNTIVMASAIGVLPVAAWIWFVVRYNQKHERGINFLMGLFFVGVLSAIPASILEIFINEIEGDSLIFRTMQQVWSYQQVPDAVAAVISSGLVAAIEEFSKGIMMFFAVLSKKMKVHNDGLVYGALVGLAFAVTENGVYFASAMNSDQSLGSVSSIIILRFLLSTTAHIIYSGMVGKFVADAVLTEDRRYRIKSYLKAFFIPVGIHLLFNWLLTTAMSPLIIIIIAGGAYFLWSCYTKHSGERDPDEVEGETIY